jgi:hypothetical protein
VTDVTRLLEAADRGDRQAAAELMPLVYDELRKLAAAKLLKRWTKLSRGWLSSTPDSQSSSICVTSAD